MQRVSSFILLILASGIFASYDYYQNQYEDERDYFASYETDETDYFEYETLPYRRQKTTSNEDYRLMSICYDKKSNTLVSKNGDTCKKDRVALGRFKNAINQTGWSYLEVETSDQFSPEIQAYAAGVVEGKLSKLLIYYHLKNTIEGYCKGYRKFCERLYDYLHKNVQWIRAELMARPNDEYWRHVNLTMTQLTGIIHGYENRQLIPHVSFDVTPIYMIQVGGELFDLEKAMGKNPNLPEDVPEAGHCTGFVRPSPGNKDLFFAHVAMSGLQTMTRVLKLYKFGYDKKQVPGHTASFSGYAGALASADDFVLLSSGLATTETTCAVHNKTLYSPQFIKPTGQLHCWLRSIVANNMAKSGRDWTRIFSRYNSGTYNNQWTVLDYKKFRKGQRLPQKDLVWVLEQMPGLVMSRDVTWFVRKYGYWASYNIPYFKKVYQYSGFANEAAKHEPDNSWWFQWENSARAKIFRRDAKKVDDIESLTKLMRYNDYKHEPYSRCKCSPPYTAEAAVSARGDLNDPNGTYAIAGMGFRNHASLDMKGTNLTLFRRLGIHAWGGPTYDPLPPFNWETTNVKAKHFGQPKIWNFKPIDQTWQTEVNVRMK